MELLSLEITRIDYVFGTLVMLLCMWLFVRKRERQDMSEDPSYRTIRELDANLRLAQRELVEAREELESREQDFQDAVTTLQETKAALAERSGQVEKLRRELEDETRKTRELRHELTDQAQEKIREAAIRREAETELEVARAGSEAVADEIERLQQAQTQRLGQQQAPATKSPAAAEVDVDINELLAD